MITLAVGIVLGVAFKPAFVMMKEIIIKAYKEVNKE